MTPPGKFAVNFYPEANGRGEPIKEGTTVDEAGAVIEPKPGRMHVPDLAISMSITFDDPAPLAEIVQDALIPPDTK